MPTASRINNRYEVIRELGDGGFGKTFLARDSQMPSARECVVKQLKPLHDNPEIYQMVKDRFGREAAILEQLGEHDQVPRLYAYFSEGGDRFYLVEEYIQGQTITQKVQQDGPQAEGTVESMLANLLPAIIHTHQNKIVHRDIKPDNIILRPSGQKPVLIDFGAVKETMSTVLNTQGNSARSIVVGTPGYMPSEQLVGRPVYASDLYSLGLTAIYMLTGKLPQQLETDPNTGAFLWQSHASKVSAGFSALLDRAIQVHAAHRFSSAQEMFMALNALSNGVAFSNGVALNNGVTLPPNGARFQQNPLPIVPADYATSGPTQAVVPAQPVPSPPVHSPKPKPMSNPEQKPVYQSISSGSEWKKPAITGGIIGLSILIGALVLKGQTNQPAPIASPQPTATATAIPAIPAKPLAIEPAKPAVEAPPAKPPLSAEEAAKAEAGTDATIVGDAGSKNVRSGPGTKYDSPHVTYPGDRIKVTATSRDEAGYTWHKVYFPKSGAEGWVAAQLLRMDAGSNAPDAPESGSDDRPSPNAAETNATIAGESGAKNIRSGPGTSYDSPHMAYPGDRVKILDTAQDKGGFTWYKVSFPKSGAEGWIAAQLLRVD